MEFHSTISPVLALILVFEEWGWEPMWARMDAFIARLPPYGALVVVFLCLR